MIDLDALRSELDAMVMKRLEKLEIPSTIPALESVALDLMRSNAELKAEIEARGPVAITARGDLLTQLHAEQEKNKGLDKDVCRLVDAATDVFGQMLKGDWKDNHGHSILLNAAMLTLSDVVKGILMVRAAKKGGDDEALEAKS